MASTKGLRTIGVDGVSFRWKVAHGHVDTVCRESFLAFDPQQRRFPLRIFFRADADRGAGYPEAGVVELWRERLFWNLNRPRLAAELIRAARLRGWAPERGAALVIEDGFPLLRGLFPDGDPPGT